MCHIPTSIDGIRGIRDASNQTRESGPRARVRRGEAHAYVRLVHTVIKEHFGGGLPTQRSVFYAWRTNVYSHDPGRIFF